MDPDQALREAHRLMVSGRHQDGLDLVTEHALGPVDRGVEHVLGKKSSEAEKVANDFIRSKLMTRQYASRDPAERDKATKAQRDLLAKANARGTKPTLYFWVAGRNFAVDYLRDKFKDELGGLIQGVLEEIEREARASGKDDDEELTRPVDARVTAIQHFLEALPDEPRLLLRVMLVDALPFPPPEQDIEAIAGNRGVAEEQVLDELEQRREYFAAARKALRIEVYRRREKLAELQALQGIVRKCMLELDPKDVEPASEIRYHFFNTASGIRNAGAEQRAAFANNLDKRVATAARKLQETETKLAQLPIKTRRWDEVATVLGRVTADTPARDRKLAINAMTVQFRKLKLEVLDPLIELLGRGEADED